MNGTKSINLVKIMETICLSNNLILKINFNNHIEVYLFCLSLGKVFYVLESLDDVCLNFKNQTGITPLRDKLLSLLAKKPEYVFLGQSLKLFYSGNIKYEINLVERPDSYALLYEHIFSLKSAFDYYSDIKAKENLILEKELKIKEEHEKQRIEQEKALKLKEERKNNFKKLEDEVDLLRLEQQKDSEMVRLQRLKREAIKKQRLV